MDEATESEQETKSEVSVVIASKQAQKVVSRVTGEPMPQPESSGEGGDFTFTDLDALAEVQKEWENHLVEIQEDLDKIRWALSYAEIPVAGDSISQHYAESITDSLRTLLDHNVALSDYAEDYIIKLKQAQGLTSDTESDAAAGFSGEM